LKNKKKSDLTINNLTRMTDTNKENEITEEILPDEYHTVVSNTVCYDVTTLEQCSICFNDIENVNVTVTRCGHRFHSSCIFEMMANGGRDCPLCRTKLAKDVQNDVDESEEYTEEDWGSDMEEDDEQEVTVTNVELMVSDNSQTYEHSMSIETLAEKLLTMGYTNVDILRLYIGNSLRTENPEKYTREFCSKLSSDIEDIIHLPERQTFVPITSNHPSVIQYSIHDLREYYQLMCIDGALQDDTEMEQPL